MTGGTRGPRLAAAAAVSQFCEAVSQLGEQHVERGAVVYLLGKVESVVDDDLTKRALRMAATVIKLHQPPGEGEKTS